MGEVLIRPLSEGSLDIIGDIHGEYGALESLISRLGYSPEGFHAEGRTLVFVGDLTDRGPDSPKVVQKVQALVGTGRAQCVLGNHDLNLMLCDEKSENGWFWGRKFFVEDVDASHPRREEVVPQTLADRTIREQVLEFFGSLPVALEREDLRVVHAAWDEEMIGKARGASDAAELYQSAVEEIEQSEGYEQLDRIDRGLRHQNDNPIKRLTSGPEERTDQPIEAGGKVRYERRVHWWETYEGPFCVFGHYGLVEDNGRGGEHAFCIDFGVGKRWKERREGVTNGYSFKLAALRFPEMEVVFDEGGSLSLTGE